MSSRLLQQTATTMSGKTLVTGLTWRQHVARVRTLYRRTLKLNFQYAFTRPAFNVLCEQTRAEFEAKKHLKEFGEIDAVYAEAESQLFVHPETYTLGWDRGGTAFMRNPPPGFQFPGDDHHDHGHGHGEHGHGEHGHAEHGHGDASHAKPHAAH